MKKSFILLFFLILISPVFADSWDDFSNLDKSWEAQKIIPNSDYEDVVNALEEKKDAVEQKKKKKKIQKAF